MIGGRLHDTVGSCQPDPADCTNSAAFCHGQSAPVSRSENDREECQARAARRIPTAIYGARKVVWQLESSEPSSSAPVRIAVAFAVPLPGIR